MSGLLNQFARYLVSAFAGIWLASCEPITVPVANVAPGETPREADGAAGLTEESQELARYYQRVESGLVAQGLLRRDGGGPDVPFSARNLVDNFVRIALFEEYTTIDGRIVARQTESQVHRWQGPIRVALHFGETVPQRQRNIDRQNIGSYLARLARLTKLPMRLVQRNGNFHVFVVHERERRLIGPRIEAILPGVSNAAIDAVVEMPRSTFCLVFASDPGDSGIYDRAVAVIRAEHPDLLRLSCIHEEIAQGLGLSNDSPAARPSIFNDDEEFGLLTSHDEMLLRILYDGRIKAGMKVGEARTTAQMIASEFFDATAPVN